MRPASRIVRNMVRAIAAASAVVLVYTQAERPGAIPIIGAGLLYGILGLVFLATFATTTSVSSQPCIGKNGITTSGPPDQGGILDRFLLSLIGLTFLSGVFSAIIFSYASTSTLTVASDFLAPVTRFAPIIMAWEATSTYPKLTIIVLSIYWLLTVPMFVASTLFFFQPRIQSRMRNDPTMHGFIIWLGVIALTFPFLSDSGILHSFGFRDSPSIHQRFSYEMGHSKTWLVIIGFALSVCAPGIAYPFMLGRYMVWMVDLGKKLRP